MWVPKVPSGRTDHAHSVYIDHRIVGGGNIKFALTDLSDIGKYVSQVITDPRTINRWVLLYTEVLSMNEIWDVMARASGEEPPKDYVRLTLGKKDYSYLNHSKLTLRQYR